MALDRFKHSIIYEQSTSEIKDDIVSLIAVVKSGTGSLNRQEAAFLLWYHALEGEDKQDELVSNGAVNACLSVVDTSDASSADKTCCAGILMTLCTEEHNRELVIRGKSPNNGATQILHALMQDGVDLLRQYAAKTLCLVAEESTSRSLLLRALDQSLPYDTYCLLMRNCQDGTAMASIANLIKSLLNGRPDLKSEALSSGLASALLSAMRYHKADMAAGALANCLLQLAMERESWSHIHKAGGINVLVDMLGPPPQSIIKFEQDHWRHLFVKEYMKGKKEGGGKEAKRSTAYSEKGYGEDAQEEGDEGKSSKSESAKEAPPAPSPGPRLPEPDPKTLLSINSAGLKWHGITTMLTSSAAAGCLYELAQSPEYMQEMSDRLAANRLVPLLISVMASGGDGKKKKGKKKGLSLQPDQIEALTRITGCLKFLSLVNINRCRIARLSAIKDLIPLYEEGPQTLLRRNAQVILSNVAMMAENGQLMLEGKLPEEFLIPVPMRSTEEELAQLNREFPPLPPKQESSDSELESPKTKAPAKK